MAEIPRTVGGHSTACASLPGAQRHLAGSSSGLAPVFRDHGFKALRQ